MAYKKLSEATFVQDAVDTANVLIEENDEIKRVPKSVMGKVKTVNGVEPDENGNVSVGEVKTVNGASPDENGNVEVPIAWEALDGKPFYEKSIEWDGDTTDKDSVTIDGYTYYKVSDVTPAPENLLGKTAQLFNNDQIITYTIFEEMVVIMDGGYVGEIDGIPGVIVATSTTITPMASPRIAESEPTSITVPSTGTYFIKINDSVPMGASAEPMNIYISKMVYELKQLDEAFIPRVNLYCNLGNNDLYLYWDPGYYNKVTKAELAEIYNNINWIVVNMNGYDINTKIMIYAKDDPDGGEYSAVGIFAGNMISLYTSEYVVEEVS